MSVLVRALVGAEKRVRAMLLIAGRRVRPGRGRPRMCCSCGTWEHGTIFATISGGDQSCRLIHWRLPVTARRRFFWGVHAALALVAEVGTRGTAQLQMPVTLQLQARVCSDPGLWSGNKRARGYLQYVPYSESEPSDIGGTPADPLRPSGRPLGKAALAGTFLPPSESKPEQNLTIQQC